jgi:hypothetical protein
VRGFGLDLQNVVSESVDGGIFLVGEVKPTVTRKVVGSSCIRGSYCSLKQGPNATNLGSQFYSIASSVYPLVDIAA